MDCYSTSLRAAKRRSSAPIMTLCIGGLYFKSPNIAVNIGFVGMVKRSSLSPMLLYSFLQSVVVITSDFDSSRSSTFR